MDPDKALVDFLEACQAGDREAAGDALDALRGWILRGGFLPQVRRLHREGESVLSRSFAIVQTRQS